MWDRSNASIPDDLKGTLQEWSGLVGQVGTSIADVANLINSLTKTTVTVTSSEIKASNSHLSTAIVGKLADAGVVVYLPEYEQLENVNVTETRSFKNYVELRRIVSAGVLRQAIIENLMENSDAAKSLSISELETLAKYSNAVQSARELLILVLTQNVSGGEEIDIEEIPLNLDLKKLEALVRAENFSTALRGGANILSVDIVKVIGTRMEKRNLITGIRNRFSGSATIQYVLTNSKGRILFADTTVIHTGSRKSSNMRRVSEPQ